MRSRSWWYFVTWLAVGAIGVGLLWPDVLSVPLARIWHGDFAKFQEVASALPGDMSSGSAPPNRYEASNAAPTVLENQSPSDHDGGLEMAFDDLDSDDALIGAWDGEAEGSLPVGDTIGGPSGGAEILHYGYGSGNGSGLVRKRSVAGGAISVGGTREETTAAGSVGVDLDNLVDDGWFDAEYSVRSIGSPKPTTTAAADEPTTSVSQPEESPGAASGAFESANLEFDDVLDEIDRKLASLPLGNIAFNAPETIPLGDSATIELLVSLREAEEELREAVSAAGPVETARVRVSPYMEASLSGLGFSIESATPARQMLSKSQRTKWQWQIETTKADALELTLTLSALFTVGGQERTRAIRTFEKTILVDVPITHRVAQFVSNNTELLGTLLVIPIVGALYRRFRRKRQRPSGVAGEMDRRAA